MKRLLIRKISLVTLLCFFSLLMTDAYVLPAAQEEDGMILIAKGEAEYSNGQYQNALDAFQQALNLVQKKDERGRLLLDISLAQYALGDKVKCQESLRSLLKLHSGRQIDMRKFPEGFSQLYGQTHWQVQEASAEQKKIEEQKQAEAKLIAEGTPGLIEKTKSPAQIKKKKFPWLLVILGVGVAAGLIFLLTKKKKEPKANYTLTVTKGAGVDGSPDSGTFSYVQGDIVNYGYTVQAGYVSLEVKLNGNDAAASGSITMDQDYSLTVNGRSENYDYDTRVLGISWVQIPAGDFKMGDSFNVGDARELPVHTVNLAAYAISKYETTFAQYDKFCDETGRAKPSDGGWGRGAMPAIGVSWNDATAFCTWLAGKTGKKIHLVTEAQWERAAAGTDQRQYPWGNDGPSCAIVNFNNCVGRPKPVGSYPASASAAGVMDLSGNVWEWAQDWFGENYYQECSNQGTVTNPQGPASGSERVLRGGGFREQTERMRCAFRDYVYADYSSKVIGFRIAWDQ